MRILVFIFLFSIQFCFGQSPFLNKSNQRWADSVFNSLSRKERIGQLIMVATRSDQAESYYKRFDFLIQNYNLGGLIFFQGTPYRQINLYNRYQGIAKVPLLMGIDGEWGLGMRLDSVLDFPKQMTLGALVNDDLIYKMGLEIGRQCRLVGVHVNFAPVADINESPRNPVIGLRSFGENRDNVTRKSMAYMRGMQQQNLITTAKHFPGHGNTISDSHFTLPKVEDSYEHLQKNALFPFKALINNGLNGILTGHLYIPSLDATPRLASSLSEKIVTDLLKKELKFEGLVFTDAMNMRGVTQGRTSIEANVKALLAGNDILLYPENVAATIDKILLGIENGTINEEIINEKVRKVLLAKSWVGLDNCLNKSEFDIYKQLNLPATRALIDDIAQQATTLLRNTNKILPFRDTKASYVSIALGETTDNVFQKTLSQIATFQHYTLPNQPYSRKDLESILGNVDSTQTVVLSIHDRRKRFNSPFIINSLTQELITTLEAKTNVIVCVFASPYCLGDVPMADALVCAYENMPQLQKAVAQQLFGRFAFRGKLPVSILNQFDNGATVQTTPSNKLIFGLPEQVGMSSQKLQKIDSIVERSITQKIFPGCQVAVAHKGRLVYKKSFGKTSYDSNAERVTNETLYDLASVTKVTATLQAVMFLYENGAIDIKQKASYYLPELQKTNKKDFTVEDLLLHRSGMVAFYPTLWERTMTKGGGLMAEWYSSQKNKIYAMQIAPKLFAKPELADSVWKNIVNSPLHQKRENGRYAFVYSDLGLVVLQKIIENVINQPLNEFLEQNLYERLEMKMTGYQPLQKFAVSQVAPTEDDYRFRHQLLRGTVHDQMAAVLGGVAGHAGLFSCASDLTILMQMLLNKGKYGQHSYLQPETIALFAKMHDSHNHRGLGWDKTPSDPNESNYVAASASKNSFGHSGFTGTMVWADPENELVFVFLSNRVNPRAENNILNKLKIRKEVHQAVYDAMK